MNPMSEFMKLKSPGLVSSVTAAGFTTAAMRWRFHDACAAFWIPARRPTRGSGLGAPTAGACWAAPTAAQAASRPAARDRDGDLTSISIDELDCDGVGPP